MTAVEATISPARLRRFMGVANGDKNLAFRFYLWNARICAELYLPIQLTEVAVRNAISAALADTYGAMWCDASAFMARLPEKFDRELNAITTKERSQRGTSFTIHHVTAGLTFGFWVHLLEPQYQHIVWKQGIRKYFPNLLQNYTLTDIYDRVERLRSFRNSVFHHYAVFDRNPPQELLNMRTIMHWICIRTLEVMDGTCNLTAVLQARPRL